jgi:hypothetical protein
MGPANRAEHAGDSAPSPQAGDQSTSTRGCSLGVHIDCSSAIEKRDV